MSQQKVQVIMNVFSKLKQKVIAKWDDDAQIDIKPKNVLIKNWLPQDDILAHKNCILFITHGGLGGVAEAKYHGVPIVGIPL
jgi:glucuronosyltransferase